MGGGEAREQELRISWFCSRGRESKTPTPIISVCEWIVLNYLFGHSNQLASCVGPILPMCQIHGDPYVVRHSPIVKGRMPQMENPFDGCHIHDILLPTP